MLQEQKPYIAVMIVQLILAGMFVLSKITIADSGMKPSVFVAYRQVMSTLFLAPFAFIRRTASPSLSWTAYFKIFIISTFGITTGLNLVYAGLKYTSPTFASAVLSITPVLVFVMSVCLRIERLGIGERYGIAKILGTLIGFSGAMAYTFYKGPSLFSHHGNPKYAEKTHVSKDQWVKGSLLVVASQVAWSMWLTMQAPLLKQYPGKFKITYLQIGFSCITSSIFGASMERDLSSWKLRWNIDLITMLYCAIVVSGLSYWLQAWVIEKKGSVFCANFGPLAIILAAILAAIFLNEAFPLGGIIGGALLVVGLYFFLWGVKKESQSKFDSSTDSAPLECIVTEHTDTCRMESWSHRACEDDTNLAEVPQREPNASNK